MDDISLLKRFITYFVGLFAIIDPVAAVPVWISLTQGYSDFRRKILLRKAVLFVFMILTTFLLLGNGVMHFFGISMASMRIAGGLMLSFTAFQMLGSKKPQKTTAEKKTVLREREDISFSPVAMPLLSGPGAIAVIVGMAGNLGLPWESPASYSLVILAIVINCALVWLTFTYAGRVAVYFGPDAILALTKIMGFILLCIGVEFIVNSLGQVFMGGAGH
jgi:multiple antibiotic resistance protein